MLYPSNELRDHLTKLGIKSNDTVMLHGNASVASQYIFTSDKDPLNCFFTELKSYLFDGTIIIPSFTYSATRGEIFDFKSTPSQIGLFSEGFRLIDGVKRSQHPIFSVCSLGNDADYYTSSKVDDCFGKGTFFDQLYCNNVKIVTLGCPFESATFVHYVEQSLDVSYRYLKKFNAKVIESGKIKEFDVSYFVRNLELNTNLNFDIFEREALKQEKITIVPFGRIKGRSILSRDFFRISSNLIRESEYALIEEVR